MLKYDKYKMVIVLSILFSNLNYFSFKKDGTIIAKKRWYSLKRVAISIQELAAVKIPMILGKIDEKTAMHYTNQISAEFNTDGHLVSNLITVMHQYVVANQSRISNLNSNYDMERKTVTEKTELVPNKVVTKKVIKKVKEKDEISTGYVIIGKIYNTVDSTLNSKYREIVRHLTAMEGRYCIA